MKKKFKYERRDEKQAETFKLVCGPNRTVFGKPNEEPQEKLVKQDVLGVQKILIFLQESFSKEKTK